MKAVILAGGKGTRLGKLTQDIPKPMIPVAGKPLLEYQVELCRRYHIEEVILLVNHLSESIYNYFKENHPGTTWFELAQDDKEWMNIVQKIH